MKSLLDEYIDLRINFYQQCINDLFVNNKVDSNVDLIHVNLEAHKKYLHFCNIIAELCKVKSLIHGL